MLGFAGAFRRSELAALTVADLEIDDAGLRVHVPRSKTDQNGKGQTVAILAGTRLKPVAAVTGWLTSLIEKLLAGYLRERGYLPK